WVSSGFGADHLSGLVFDKQSKQLMYKEIHKISNKQHEVTYQTPEGVVFARKIMAFNGASYQPDVDFSNTYCDESYRIQTEEKRVALEYNNRCDKTRKKSALKIKQPFVIDAGFSDFIFEQMIKEESKQTDFYYPVPSRAQWVKMRAKKMPCNKLKKQIHPYHQTKSIEMQQCIKVTPTNWLIEQVFPPIFLAFNDQHLTFFSGRSNMANQKGNYQNLVIFYSSNQ
ncbi:MAG: hypothetical protein OXE99_04910, partial [Cellvibrionales bacterium]|nr:hypothetical protein [Cellvibrionales bacterium]